MRSSSQFWRNSGQFGRRTSNAAANAVRFLNGPANSMGSLCIIHTNCVLSNLNACYALTDPTVFQQYLRLLCSSILVMHYESWHYYARPKAILYNVGSMQSQSILRSHWCVGVHSYILSRRQLSFRASQISEKNIKQISASSEPDRLNSIPHLQVVSGDERTRLTSYRHISHVLPTVYRPESKGSMGSLFFATGNKNKVKEVRLTAGGAIWHLSKDFTHHAMTCMQVVAILEAGSTLPFNIQAASLDLPELQGEPDEIAKEKCRLASQQVSCLLTAE